MCTWCMYNLFRFMYVWDIYCVCIKDYEFNEVIIT